MEKFTIRITTKVVIIKTVKMKIVLSIGIILTSISLWSQNVCSSIQLGDTYTSLQINQAIENANLCGYFLDSENAMLSFDDGGIVYLKSKQELINEGQSWIENCNHFTAVSGEQSFSITKDGVIVIRAISPSKKYKTIKN